MEQLKRIVNRSTEAGGRVPAKVPQKRIDLERALQYAKTELAAVQGNTQADRQLRIDIGARIIALERALLAQK